MILLKLSGKTEFWVSEYIVSGYIVDIFFFVWIHCVGV